MVLLHVKNRIMAVLKVETDIITSMKTSLIGQAVILVIMCVKTFKTDVIVFIGNVIMCLTSHWLIVFSIRVHLSILTRSYGETNYKEDIQITDKQNYYLVFTIVSFIIKYIYIVIIVVFGVWCIASTGQLSSRKISYLMD